MAGNRTMGLPEMVVRLSAISAKRCRSRACSFNHPPAAATLELIGLGMGRSVLQVMQQRPRMRRIRRVDYRLAHLRMAAMAGMGAARPSAVSVVMRRQVPPA